jgi:O-antigen/teichoic acid export membrane protein
MRLTPKRLHLLWYAPLLAVAMGFMLVRTLVLARILSLEAFAEFSAGLLVSGTFCMLACLGLYPLLQREYPMQAVRRRERAAALLLVQSALAALACAGILLVLAGIGVSPPSMTSALFGVGVLHGLSQQVFLVATVESRSRGEPLRFATQNFVRASLALVASLAVAAWSQSVTAVLIVEAALSIAMARAALTGMWKRCRMTEWAAVVLAVRRLPRVPWSAALAMLVVSAISFAQLNFDRWIAVETLPPTVFAQYAFAWTVLIIAQSAQAIVNASVYPTMARRFAADGSEPAFRLCLRTSTALLVGGVLLAAPAWMVLQWLVAVWYPAFEPALPAILIFLLVGVLRVSDFWTSFLLVCGLEKRLIVVNVAALAAVAGGWLWWTHSTAAGPTTIRAVAWLAVAMAVVSYLALALTSWRAVSEARKEGLLRA